MLALWLGLVAGCAGQNGTMKPHYEGAVGELDQAVAAKANAKQPEAVSQALLPPLIEIGRAHV